MADITLGETGTRYGASMEIRGWDNLRANLRVIAEKYPEELGQGLKEEGYAIMTESLKECPYDPTNDHEEDGGLHLNDTADVQGPFIDGGNVSVALTYSKPYAVIQHETQGFDHPTPGTKWKFLEDPMMQRAPFLATNLIRAVNLERMNVGYSATPTATLTQNLRVRAAKLRYGNLLGRFV